MAMKKIAQSDQSRKKSGNAKERMIAGWPVRNTLLLRIPEQEFLTIQPHLEFVTFENGTTLQREGSRIDAVYFLNKGIGSIIVEAADGKSVEVGMAGHEDMIGLQLAAGLDEFTHSVIAQMRGDGFRVRGTTMKRILTSLPELSRLLLRRLAIRSVVFAQNAACNRLHTVKRRLARWLLLTHDRADSDIIRTTHDYLSRMVGTDRPTVTLAVAELEKNGVIQRARASISIDNRSKLEQEACECYGLYRAFNAELGLRT
jgi:CRP-like cAMP-binding protein